jgi:hypothetical protein
VAERRSKVSYFWIVGEKDGWVAHCYWDMVTIRRFIWNREPATRSEAESLIKELISAKNSEYASYHDKEYQGWKYRYVPDASGNKTLLDIILKAKCGVSGYEYLGDR